MRLIILRFIVCSIVLLLSLQLFAQIDSVLSKHKWCFSVGAHCNYWYNKPEYRSDLPKPVDGLRIISMKPAVGFNSSLLYIYSRKRVLFKTGLLYYNFRIVREYQLDTTYLGYYNNLFLIGQNGSSNSFMLPLMIGLQYKRIFLFIGNNLDIIDFKDGKVKYFDNTTKQSIWKKTDINIDYLFRGVRNNFFYPTIEIQYLIYKDKINLLSSAHMILVDYFSVGFFNIGFNVSVLF